MTLKHKDVGTEIEDLIVPLKTQPKWYEALPPFYMDLRMRHL
jgi:hypothetical protein